MKGKGVDNFNVNCEVSESNVSVTFVINKRHLALWNVLESSLEIKYLYNLDSFRWNKPFKIFKAPLKTVRYPLKTHQK